MGTFKQPPSRVGRQHELISAYLDPEDAVRLRALAIATDRSMAAEIRQAIKAWLREHEEKVAA